MLNKKTNALYMILLVIFLVSLNEFLKINKFEGTFSQKIVVDMVSTCLVFFLLGLILSLEYLYKEKKKSGKWKIDIYKFVLIFLPCFILMIYKFIWFFGFYTLPEYLANSPDNFYYMVSVVSGYILSTCFYKE